MANLSGYSHRDNTEHFPVCAHACKAQRIPVECPVSHFSVQGLLMSACTAPNLATAYYTMFLHVQARTNQGEWFCLKLFGQNSKENDIQI